MQILLALFLATAMPSASNTSWMRPESFQLSIGMRRYDALQKLAMWNPKQGKDANELIVDYSGDKALTLQFRNDRVQSIRFELFVFLPEVRKAFQAERDYLSETFGKPRMTTPSIVIYDNTLPNIMAVVADDPKSTQGKRGLGVVAVRYYDPR